MTVTIPTDAEIASFAHEHDVMRRHAAQFYAGWLPYLANYRTPEREELTVLAHDEEGRILKTQKQRIPAFNGAEHLDYLAHRDLNADLAIFEEHDEVHGTRYSAYMRLVLAALDSSTGFVARLKALCDAKDAEAWWSYVDSLQGHRRTEARVYARMGQRQNAIQERQGEVRPATEAELETHNTISSRAMPRYTSITS